MEHLSRSRIAGFSHHAPSLTLPGSLESGSVSIETAMAFMLMMTCVLAIMGFAVMVYTYSVYQDAARYGVRYATLHGADSANCSGPTIGCGDQTGSNVVAAVQNYASPYAAPIDGMLVQVTYPDAGGCKAPSRVIVTVNYTYVPLIQTLGSSVVFTTSSQGRIVY